MLEIREPDTDHNHSEECVVGAGDAFAEKDDLRSVDAIDIGIADEYAFIVIVFEVQKMVAIRKVNFGRWPLSRRIHKPPILSTSPINSACCRRDRRSVRN